MSKSTCQFRIDPLVLNWFIWCLLITLSSFGYKYYYYEPCGEIKFEAVGETHRVGELIKFEDYTQRAKTYEWDFGDNSEYATDKSPIHVYQEAGEYLIKLTVNNSRSAMQKLVILEKEPLINQDLIPKFSTPADIIAGQPVRFTCFTQGATSWTWRFGESGQVDASRRTASYTFLKPGKKTVCLIINDNNKYIAKKTIYVKPKPHEKKMKTVEAPLEQVQIEPYIPYAPEEFKAFEEIKKQEEQKPYIPGDEELIAMLYNYAAGQLKAEAFEPFLCLGTDKAIVNANKELMKFSDFLEDIKGSDIRMKEFVSIREEDKCIVRIDVRYKKKIKIF